jgi:hypothetical protein
VIKKSVNREEYVVNFIMLLENLRGHPERFFEYARMSISGFDFLSSELEHHLLKLEKTCFKRTN